jgi:ATP-binding cassette subfamily F protein 3
MLALSRVSRSYGTTPLFSDVSFQLTPGHRVALVGGNGTGKTTLLEIALGEQDPDEGEVTRPRALTIGYLPQDVTDVDHGTVLDQVLRGAEEVRAAETRMRELEQRLASTAGPEHDAAMTAYAEAQHHFESLGGYALEAEAHRVLAGLGFAPDDAGRDVGELSGGWRVRVALARLLLRRPDVLVLDEPTNHLDLGSIRWLEQALVEFEGALLFVSHDRDFIDAVANRVVELAAGTTVEYVVTPGGRTGEGAFAQFLAQRDERLAQLRAAREQQDRRVAEIERFVERFRYKASKARQVQSRIKHLERIDRVEVPEDRELRARFAFPDPPRSGRVVAELSGVRKAFDGRVVLDDVDVVIERGWKVAVLGPNGAGKSTLLNLLLERLRPDAGEVSLGHNVEVAHFAQHAVDDLRLDRTVVEEFSAGLREEHRGRNVRTMLGAFGFPGDLADRRVGDLSGGEQTRLALAKLMASPVSLLCLDEPTNHLDIASRGVLEEALTAYPGTVLLITHDRAVIRAVADHVLEVGDGRAVLHEGDYEHLVWKHGGDPTDGAAPAASPPTAPLPEPRDRRSDKRAEAERRNALYRATRELRRKVERLEQQVTRAEAEVAELTRELADPSVYDDETRVKQLVARHGDAKDRAAELAEAWEDAVLALEAEEARVEEEHAGT